MDNEKILLKWKCVIDCLNITDDYIKLVASVYAETLLMRQGYVPLIEYPTFPTLQQLNNTKSTINFIPINLKTLSLIDYNNIDIVICQNPMDIPVRHIAISNIDDIRFGLNIMEQYENMIINETVKCINNEIKNKNKLIIYNLIDDIVVNYTFNNISATIRFNTE
jgi:hypothetical protein